MCKQAERLHKTSENMVCYATGGAFYSINKKRMAKIRQQLIDAVEKLEVHHYAPEMNKLHFKNGAVLNCGWSIEQQYHYTIENSVDLVLMNLIRNNNYRFYVK